MKKTLPLNWLFFICFAFLIIEINGQDIITKNDDTKIQAKILEMSSSEIKYKRFDYKDGPTVTLSTSEIKSIKYPNGKIETFKKNNVTASASQTSTTISQNGFNDKSEAKNELRNELKQGKWVEYKNSEYKPTAQENAQYYLLTIYKDDIPQGIQREFFKSGQLRFETTYSNGKKNGIEKMYQESGKLAGETSFIDGKKNGLQKGYYENGNKSIECYFKDDKKDGILKMYEENGQLSMEAIYRDDIKNGIYKNYNSVNGQLMWETIYLDGKKNGVNKDYYKGELVRETPYVNDLIEGKKIDYEDGKIIRETYYVGGLKNGEAKEYLGEEGTLSNSTSYKDDKKDGASKAYRTDGSVIYEYNYKNDKKEGTSQSYDKDGKTWATSDYKDDKRDGTQKIYNSKGRVSSKTEYKDGVKGKSRSFIVAQVLGEILVGTAEGLSKNQTEKNTENSSESSAITNTTTSGKDGNSPEAKACSKEAKDQWESSTEYKTWRKSVNDITAPSLRYGEIAKAQYADIILQHCGQYLSETEKAALLSAKDNCIKNANEMNGNTINPK